LWNAALAPRLKRYSETLILEPRSNLGTHSLQARLCPDMLTPTVERPWICSIAPTHELFAKNACTLLLLSHVISPSIPGVCQTSFHQARYNLAAHQLHAPLLLPMVLPCIERYCQALVEEARQDLAACMPHVLLLLPMLPPCVERYRQASVDEAGNDPAADILHMPLLLPMLPPCVERHRQASADEAGNDPAADILHMPLLSCMFLQEAKSQLQHTKSPKE